MKNNLIIGITLVAMSLPACRSAQKTELSDQSRRESDFAALVTEFARDSAADALEVTLDRPVLSIYCGDTLKTELKAGSVTARKGRVRAARSGKTADACAHFERRDSVAAIRRETPRSVAIAGEVSSRPWPWLALAAAVVILCIILRRRLS